MTPTQTVFNDSIKNMDIINKGDYKYFVHPLSDGVFSITPELLEEVTELLIHKIDMCKFLDVTKIMTIESMGIPITTALSLKMQIPFVIARKRTYGLPGEIKVTTSTGYSRSEVYLNNISPDDNLLIIDDVISTGGTLSAILKALPCAVSQIIVLFEKGVGKQKIRNMGYDIQAVHKIEL